MNEKIPVTTDKSASERIAAANAAIKREYEEALQAARTLRDEIRVDIHLAGMDAKDTWKKIEPNLFEAEKFGAEVSDAAKTAAASVVRSFRTLRDTIKRNIAEQKH